MFSIYFKKIIKVLLLNKSGNILLFAMIFGTISLSIIVVGLSGYAISENSASTKKHNREMALQIADAGINYYRWHLAHSKTDYYDGNSTSTPGPYVHDYEDKDGNVIGQYSINITPPALGSSVVVIESTGWLNSQANTRVKIRAKVGFPSLTDFSFLSAAEVWIGDNEIVHGKLHANGGIRFDGLADALISSAMATYTCKSHQGCGTNQVKNGVWGDGGPTEYWTFPLPAEDFTAITANLAQVQANADPNVGGITFTSSGEQGWRLQFTSTSQVIAYKVLTTSCYKGKDVGQNNYFWPCIDIATIGSGTTYDMPASGFIFVSDNVWVDGVVKGRVTVGTATGKSIIINGNITYSAKDGTDVLGLMAEQNILIPHDSPENLEIDAGMLAQNGAAKRYYYPGDKKTSLLTYGSIITNKVWTWSWVSGGGAVTSGYLSTNATYDVNLSYGPPPGFPVGSEYNLISWEVVK